MLHGKVSWKNTIYFSHNSIFLVFFFLHKKYFYFLGSSLVEKVILFLFYTLFRTHMQTRPDTRPIPVADGWAGAEMRVCPLLNLITMTDRLTDGLTNRSMERENKAGYTANTSRGWVGRGGNARFHTFKLDHHGPTNQPTDWPTDRRTKPLIESLVRD